jgi:hypothetical protein
MYEKDKANSGFNLSQRVEMEKKSVSTTISLTRLEWIMLGGTW